MDRVAQPSGGAVPPTTTTATATLVPELLSYRAQLIQRAASQIPYTAEGLPVGYYRTDLLPTAPTNAQEEVQSLKNAYADLSFEHGYPTLFDSRPFWHKLDFEPGFAYGAFQIYLELINVGPREISSLSENAELLAIASQSHGLPQGELIPKAQLGRLINECSILYYWRSRAKAHDIYKEAANRHIRLRRQTSTEDNHFTIADNLLKKLMTEVLGGQSIWAEMSPKTAVDMLKALVLIQRVSVGLPASGPLSQKETPEDVTFEMIMRTLGQKMHQSGNVYENGGQAHGGGRLLDAVLKDPNTAASMQEVIIRVQKAHRDVQTLPNPYEGGQARRFTGRPKANGNGNGNGSGEHGISADDIVPFDLSGAPGENLDGSNDNPEPPARQDKGNGKVH
jgi:hypothetical protein